MMREWMKQSRSAKPKAWQPSSDLPKVHNRSSVLRPSSSLYLQLLLKLSDHLGMHDRVLNIQARQSRAAANPKQASPAAMQP